MKTVYRYEVPIDDKEYTFSLVDVPMGHIEVAVNGGQPVIEFWTEHDERAVKTDYTFRVFGTGHNIPDNFYYVNTAPRWRGLVFHLYLKMPGKR